MDLKTLNTKQLVFMLSAAFVLSCGQKSQDSSVPIDSIRTTQQSCEGFVQTPDGHLVGIDRKIIFTLSPELSKDFVAAIQSAMNVWNEALGKEVFSLSDNGSLESSSMQGMTDWPEDKSDQQADTSLNLDGNSITRATIKIDAKNFSFSTNHDPSPNSVMYLKLSLATKRTSLSDSDISHIKCQYK
jgi:hypothetical protein